MKKIIEIVHCANCPYLMSTGDEKHHWCFNKQDGDDTILDIEVIPSWCPLKDAEPAPEVVKGKFETECPSCAGTGLSSPDCQCHGGGMATTECSPCYTCHGTGIQQPAPTEPAKKQVIERIAELNLHYLDLCKRRDDYTPAMVEPELTNQIYSLLSEGQLEVLNDEELMIIYLGTDKQGVEFYKLIAKAQLAADQLVVNGLIAERELLLEANKSHQQMVEKLNGQIDNQKEVIARYQKALKDLGVVAEKLKAENVELVETIYKD